MATCKVKHGKGKYHDNSAYQNLVAYITNPDKVREGGILGAAVIPEIAAQSMQSVAHAYHKEDGLKLRHTILSFDAQDQVSIQAVKKIAKQVMDFYADDYQILAAIHENTSHPHIHFVMNTVSYRDGHKYQGTKKEYYDYIKHVKNVTRQYGVQTVPVKDD